MGNKGKWVMFYGSYQTGAQQYLPPGHGGLRTGHVEEHSRARAISNAPHWLTGDLLLSAEMHRPRWGMRVFRVLATIGTSYWESKLGIKYRHWLLVISDTWQSWVNNLKGHVSLIIKSISWVRWEGGLALQEKQFEIFKHANEDVF